MDQEWILLESRIDSQDQKLDRLTTQMRDLSQSIHSLGETLDNFIESRGKMMISCVKQQERESNLDVKVSRCCGGDGHAKELKSWQPCLSMLNKRIKGLLPLCSQTETKEITYDLEEESKESAEALVVLEDVENEESPRDFQEELTDSSFIKGESQEVSGDFKEKLMEGRLSKLFAELTNPDRSTICFAESAQRLFDESPEPNSIKDKPSEPTNYSVLHNTWYAFDGHESPNSNNLNSQLSYLSNQLAVTPKPPLDRHISNYSNALVHQMSDREYHLMTIYTICWDLRCAHKVLDESLKPDLIMQLPLTILYADWGRKPPKPPDYTFSFTIQPSYHTTIVKPPDPVNFYSAWHGPCGHQSSKPPKPPDYIMLFQSNKLSIGNTFNGSQIESLNQGLHICSLLINLYFKYSVWAAHKLFENSEQNLAGWDPLISCVLVLCSVGIDLVGREQVHGIVTATSLETNGLAQFFRTIKVSMVNDYDWCMLIIVFGSYGRLFNMELLERLITTERRLGDIECLISKELSNESADPTYKHEAQVYFEYIRSFRVEFDEFFRDGSITEIEIGLVVCGDSWYPPYPIKHGWKYPGIGELQCYGKYQRRFLEKVAELKGYSFWVRLPDHAGSYISQPHDTKSFSERGEYDNASRRFFLHRYSWYLIHHGDRELAMDTLTFEGFHNWTNRDGYAPISLMLKKHDTVLNFTCVELRTLDQQEDFPGNRSLDPLIFEDLDCREEGEDAAKVVERRGKTKAFVPFTFPDITNIAGQVFGLYYLKRLAYQICYTLGFITYFTLIKVVLFYGGITVETLKGKLNGEKVEQLTTQTQQKPIKVDFLTFRLEDKPVPYGGGIDREYIMGHFYYTNSPMGLGLSSCKIIHKAD